MVWVEQWMKQEGLKLQRRCSRTLSRGTVSLGRTTPSAAPAGPDKLAANRKFSATTAGSQTFFKCHNFPPPLLSDADIASITKCHHRGNQCIDCQIQMSVETSVSRKEEGPHPSEAPHWGQVRITTWENVVQFHGFLTLAWLQTIISVWSLLDPIDSLGSCHIFHKKTDTAAQN